MIVFVLLIVFLLIVPFLIPLKDDGVNPSSLAIDGGHFVMINGLETYVVERGPKDGIPVIFLHGLFGSTYTWRHQLDVLAAAGYRVIAFDRPGAELTDKPATANYAYTSQADFTAALLDALIIQKAVIVGHSAGANVLAHFALRHAGRVDRLVMIDSAIVGQRGPSAFLGRLVSFAPMTRWARLGMQAFFNQDRLVASLRSFYTDTAIATPDTIAAYWRTFQTKGWDVGFIGLIRDSAGNKLSDAEVNAIKARTLILWGEHDTWTPLAQGEQLKKLLGNVAAFVVIANTGHQPMEEAPTVFNNYLLAFLGQH